MFSCFKIFFRGGGTRALGICLVFIVKKQGNDEELTQSNSTSRPQSQRGKKNDHERHAQ